MSFSIRNRCRFVGVRKQPGGQRGAPKITTTTEKERTIAKISNNEPTTVLCIVLGDFLQCVFLLLCSSRHGDDAMYVCAMCVGGSFERRRNRDSRFLSLNVGRPTVVMHRK